MSNQNIYDNQEFFDGYKKLRGQVCLGRKEKARQYPYKGYIILTDEKIRCRIR